MGQPQSVWKRNTQAPAPGIHTPLWRVGDGRKTPKLQSHSRADATMMRWQMCCREKEKIEYVVGRWERNQSWVVCAVWRQVDDLEMLQCWGTGRYKEPVHPHGAMVISSSGLPSRSVTLPQLGFVLISVAHAAIESHLDVIGLGCCLRPYWWLELVLTLETILMWVGYAAPWGFGEFLARDAAEGYVWVCGSAAAKGWDNVHGLCYHQKPGRWTRR